MRHRRGASHPAGAPAIRVLAMKILKWALAIVGVAGLIAAAVLLGRFALDSRELIGAAQRYDGGRVIPDPFVTTSMIAAIGAAAGLLIGLGLGLPTRTPGAVRRATLDEVNQGRSDAIAAKAVGNPALPEGPKGTIGPEGTTRTEGPEARA